MIYVIGNTLFGYPKMTDIQFDYFKNSFIPHLKKNYQVGDVLIHTGNIFYNKQTINFKVLKDTFEILDELSSFIQIIFLKGSNDDLSIDLMDRNKNIKVFKETKKIKNIMFVPNGEFLITDNETNYLFHHTSNKETTGVIRSFNGFYDNKKSSGINIYISSPYELNKEYSFTPHGFYEFNIKQNEIRFIENVYSPKFKEIYIDDISELNSINTETHDFIDLIIKSSAVEKVENKNKLEIFTTKYNINNIYYTDEYNNKSELNMVINNNDIRDILIDNADEEIAKNLKEIFVIHDNSKRTES
jgi:hypothetical protein